MSDSVFSSTMQIDFSCTLSVVPGHAYNIVAIFLKEQMVVVSVVNNKSIID